MPASASLSMPYPAYAEYPSAPGISAVQTDGGTVSVRWEDGLESRYHAIFLRDHAPDPDTFNFETREHSREADSYPAGLKVSQAAITEAGALRLTFAPEGLNATFHSGWLRANDYSNRVTQDPAAIAPTPWRGETLSEIPTFEGANILTDEAALSDWLVAIAEYGLGRLRNVSTQDGTVLKVARRIGPVRTSNFGEIFDVKAKVSPDSNAYTGLALFPHTDLCTREYEPGLQFLHCIENSVPGGNALYIDALAVAHDIRNEEPETFEALTALPWSFSNRAKDTDYRWRTPIIVLGPDGEVAEIRLTGFLRSPPDLPFDDVPRAYAAMQALCTRLRDPKYALSFAYAPGDLVCFDNRRILHGREAFDPGGGSRWLQGCYADKDGLRSAYDAMCRAGMLEAAE